MNAAPFPGSGIRIAPASEQVSETPDFSQVNGSWREPHDTVREALVSEDLANDLAKEMPAQTAILSGRAALDKSIADDIAEEAKLLAIMASTAAKHRQIKSTRRAKEDMRDSMAASEG